MQTSEWETPARVPPHNLEAEICTLASMILDGDVVDAVCEFVSAEDFYRPAHQKIFAAILSAHGTVVLQGGGKIDMVLVVNELRRSGVLEEVGGVDYLIQMVEGVPTAENAVYYAKVVLDRALLRRVIVESQSVGSKAWDAGESGEAVVSYWQQRAHEVAGKIERQVPISEVTAGLVQAEKQEAGLALGLADLDFQIGGLRPGNYFVLGARPGRGKTTLALNIAAHLCQSDKPVIYFTREMSREELLARLLCGRATVRADRLRNRTLDEKERGELESAKSEIDKWPLEIDSRAATVIQIASAIRRFASRSRRPVSLAVIDYFQLLHGAGKSRYERFSEISTSLKAMAMALRIPIIVLSQFNRPEKGQEGNHPTMYQLKETGSLEQDADQVLLMHCPEVDHNGQNMLQLCLDKNRHGPEVGWGVAQMEWWPSYGTMRPVEYT